MPELPEVETAARSLAAQVTGSRIAGIEKLDWERMVETPSPADLYALLPGRTIAQAGRRAKWLLLTLDAGWTLAVHLRMSGSLTVQAPAEPDDTHTHLIIALTDGRRIFFHDPRKFGRVRLLDAHGLALLDAAHGVEPLTAAFDVAAFTALLQPRRTALKPLLLNQQLLAGMGNIYVDEALWLSQLHPLRAACSLAAAETATLHAAIKQVLEQGIANEGSTLRNYRTGYGRSGSNQHYFKVYGRTGQPCPRCGTTIVRLVVAQRGTHICPQCQPAPLPA